MKDTFRLCRKCGKPVGLINTRPYRSILVDADAVQVKANEFGNEYIRWDGTKIRAREADPGEVLGVEFAYRPHRCEDNDL